MFPTFGVLHLMREVMTPPAVFYRATSVISRRISYWDSGSLAGVGLTGADRGGLTWDLTKPLRVDFEFEGGDRTPGGDRTQGSVLSLQQARERCEPLEQLVDDRGRS